MIDADGRSVDEKRFIHNTAALIQYAQFLYEKSQTSRKLENCPSTYLVALIPICLRHLEHSQQLKTIIEEKSSAKVLIYAPEFPLSERVKSANKENIRFLITLGDREVEGQRLSVRLGHEGNRVECLSVAEFTEVLKQRIKCTQP